MDQQKSSDRSSAPTGKLDLSSINPLGLLHFGEDNLMTVMRGVTEVLGLGRMTGFPVDKQQLQLLTSRLAPMPEFLKSLSMYLRRLRITEDLLNMVIPEEDLQPEEFIPLKSDSNGNAPEDADKELRNSVSEELWKEYMELQEKLIKQDTYLKTIIDAERMFLQEVNCLLHPA